MDVKRAWTWLAASGFALGGSATAATVQTVPDRTDAANLARAMEAQAEPRASRGLPARPVVTPGPDGGSAVLSTVPVGAIRITGARRLPLAAFAQVIDANVGRELSPNELRRLAGDLAAVARARGFGLATAWIPPQRVVGRVLEVVLDEGAIDAVDVTGAAERPVARLLAPLVGAGPQSTKVVEQRLQHAGDVSGVRIVRTRLDRRAGRNVLVVETRREAASAQLSLDNWGTDAVGPVRAQASVWLNGAIADDDSLNLGAVTTPFQPREFNLVRAAYDKGVGTAGTRLSINGYYAQSRPGAALASRQLRGQSMSVSFEVSQPLIRTRRAGLWLEGGVDVRDAEQRRAGTLTRDDRIATVRLSANGFVRQEKERARGRMSLVRGIAAFGASGRTQRLASRGDADATFTKIEAWGDYEAPLAQRVSLRIAAEAQLADQPLLSSEEFGFGGRSFGRGYDYREVSGDRGIGGSAELRFDLTKLPRPVRAIQLYAYGDIGTVGNADGGFGGGTLASAGGGLRLSTTKVTGSLELGVPLKDARFASSSRDLRASFTLSTRF